MSSTGRCNCRRAIDASPTDGRYLAPHDVNAFGSEVDVTAVVGSIVVGARGTTVFTAPLAAGDAVSAPEHRWSASAEVGALMADPVELICYLGLYDGQLLGWWLHS